MMIYIYIYIYDISRLRVKNDDIYNPTLLHGVSKDNFTLLYFIFSDFQVHVPIAYENGRS